MSDIPDGVDFNVAKIAIAWELTKIILPDRPDSSEWDIDKRIDEYTRYFRRIYNQLLSEPSGK